MKKQTLAACVFAAITLSMYSCGWLGKKSETHTTAQAWLVGKWRLTGLKDSSKRDSDFGSIYLAYFNADSVKTFATFNADSSLTISYSSKQAPETTRYYIDTASQRIFVKEDTGYTPFAIATFNDTLLRVTSDSMYFELKKQP